MIRICTLQTDDLPSVENLLGRLSFDVGDDKRASLLRAKPETAAASLAGLWLLCRMAEESGISLSGMTLSQEAGGRPYFPGALPDFSISHTRGIVACALSISDSASPPARIGLDIERLGERSSTSMERIVSRFFSDAERSLFLASPDERTFLEIWTGKEALCKQDGIGLSGISRFDTLAPENQRRLTVYHTPSAIITLAAPEECAKSFEEG